MAKRFTDSDKFRDNWYRKLKPKHKCLWELFLSECDVAGVFEIDLDSLTFHIGEHIESSDLDAFKDRIIFIEDDLIFIPKFIKFQQPSGLNENNKAHNNIFKTLEKYGININLPFKDLQSHFQGASEELPSSPSKGNGKGNGKGNTLIIEKREIEKKPQKEIPKEMLEECLGGKVSKNLPQYENAKGLRELIECNYMARNNNTKVKFNIESWSNELRLLEKEVGSDRMQKAMVWYSDHIGGEYIPECYTASTFRKKFAGIERAMARGNNTKKIENTREKNINAMNQGGF